ncbi:TATA box-binding protein-associated factor RNA polymerase I subunit C-like [Neosynchiropus ocellatus]
MDYHFPEQLFPAFYNSGPPDPTVRPTGGGTWGSYDRLVPQMENFYLDHVQDAFGCMSGLIYESLTSLSAGKTKKDVLGTFMQNIQKNPRTQSFKCRRFRACTGLLSDVVPDIPPELLGTLLYEELTEQRDEKLFSQKATGGALAFIPFSEHQNDSGQGCLLYPGGQGLNRLNILCLFPRELTPDFHRVALQHGDSSSFHLDTSSSPYRVQLKAPVRQISFASLSSEHCVAVRSDHFCGVWKYIENRDPCLLQVVNTKEKASCISASPHVLGEVLVASERGSAHLWSAGTRMQKVREESANLYFNANSQWRWCEFSAHPRVMTYADRTGAELTDMRMRPATCRTLFRISRAADCHAGERLITCRYLRDVHPFHHIIATQYTAYLLDERLPGVPMLKMDHMMQSPPVFCHVSSGVGTTKVLLGSQSSQEITLLQYSGGRMEASSSCGPPRALLSPRDSLKLLPVQIPHRQATASDRLSSHAAESKLEDLSKTLDLPSLRREMKGCMASRSLLVNRGTSSSPDSVVPFPDMVDTSQWQDHLSERLTLSWQGETAWRDWWKDHLGLNRGEKLEALKMKRRRQKAAKRARGQVSLSGSFSSSYMTDPEYLSDSSGWCSQRTWSDAEELGSLSQLKGAEEPRTPRPSQGGAAAPSTASTPQRLRVQSESQMSPGRPLVLSQSLTSPKVPTPSSHGGSPVKTPRKSLFGDQPGWFSQDEVTEAPRPWAATPQLTASQSSSLGNVDICASQGLSDFSQSSTRTSQWRARLSQSSQPKKKSRMGF